MKKIRKSVATLSAAALFVGLALNFNACTEQSPLSANRDESTTTLAKVRTDDSSYPQSTSGVVRFHKTKKQYRGLSLDLPNGSTFYVLGGALTPPADIAFGDPVTITMTCEKNSLNNELLFTFGPSVNARPTVDSRSTPSWASCRSGATPTRVCGSSRTP